jgi:hypothetical protein
MSKNNYRPPKQYQAPKPSEITEYFSYPETPRKHLDSCVANLKKCLDKVPVNETSYMIIRRVIKDIEFTAGKIC